jgi:rhomboid protease GluP
MNEYRDANNLPREEDFVLTEEDFLPAPKKSPSPMAAVPPLRFLNLPVWMAIGFAIASIAYWQNPGKFPLWVSQASLLKDHQYWKLFTALFTHSDMLHLLSNLPLFLIFGWHLRAFFGLVIFPVLAVVAGALANFLTVILYEEQTRLLGASGMLYAMVALWLVYYVRFETAYRFWNKVMRATGFALILLFPTTFQENVSYLAHFWGFICGMVLGALFFPITSIQTDNFQAQEPAPGETSRSGLQDSNGTTSTTVRR